MAWCKTNFGDFTGSAAKIHFLNWTDQPFAEWFQHPIFTASGLWFFLKGNLASFWQGELLWHRQPLASPATDLIYTLLTLALPASALLVLLKRPMRFSSPQRRALGFAFAGLAALFAFFALLSVKCDFQDFFYPSRAQPFFISGRLLLGALIPVMILLATGLDFAMKPFAARTKLAALAALVLLMLGSEIATD